MPQTQTNSEEIGQLNQDFIPFKSIEFQEIINKDGFIITASLFGTLSATATNYGIFFIAPFKCKVVKIKEVHTTAGTDLGAVGLNIERLQGTEALDAGDELLASNINLKGTINTVLTPALTTTKANRVLAEGDRLALKDSGVLTAVAGVQITIYLKRIGKGHYN